MSAENPVSPKVVAASAGAGAGATLTAFLIWLIGAWLYGVGFDASLADDAVAAVPDQVVGIIGLILVVAGAAIPGWSVVDKDRAVSGSSEPTEFVPSQEDLGYPDVVDETPSVEEPEVEAPVESPDQTEELVLQDQSNENPGDSRPIYGQGN